MKRIISTIGIVLLVLTFGKAQNTPEPKDNMSKQMEQMSRTMAEQLKKMFGGEEGDSTQNFGFSLKNSPFGQMDTTMSQSFAMLFDGKNWQKLSPNGDTSMMESLRGLQNRMPDFGNSFNVENMFKGLTDMFKDGFPMAPNSDAMPRVQPLDKRRKGDDVKKNGKYETEKL